MMSHPMRKPGMPQGLERPDKQMELRRPTLLGGPEAPSSPRMAVYILGEMWGDIRYLLGSIHFYSILADLTKIDGLMANKANNGL